MYIANAWLGPFKFNASLSQTTITTYATTRLLLESTADLNAS